MLGLRRDGGLARTLRLLTLCFYGMAVILGVGVYAVVGEAGAVAGEALWRSFVLAAVPVVLTGLSYAELTAAWPDAGAEYSWLRQAFPKARVVRFAMGLALLLASLAMATAVAVQFGKVLALVSVVPAALGALILLSACTALNVVGMRWSTPAVIGLTLAEVGGLLAVVVLGTTSPSFGDALVAAPSAGIVAGASLVFVAYLGFEDLANLAEETRSPARNLPAAILVCLAVSTFLYVLVSLAVAALVDPARLGGDATLLDAVSRASPALARGLGVVLLFGAANTVLVAILAASRMAFAMARGRDLPPILAAVHPQRRVPVPAVLATGAVAMVLVPLAWTGGLGAVASFGAVLGFVVVNLSVVVLRIRQPGRRRPFRVPLDIGRVPLLPIAGAASAIALTTRFPAPVFVVAAAAMALAAVAWFATALTRRPA
jgi:amino acid transporter